VIEVVVAEGEAKAEERCPGHQYNEWGFDLFSNYQSGYNYGERRRCDPERPIDAWRGGVEKGGAQYRGKDCGGPDKGCSVISHWSWLYAEYFMI
jgi:hypothetical protein